MNVKIYFDGACNNHAETKPMGIGVAVFIDGKYEEELCLAIGINDGDIEDPSTSNIAEWIGCVEAMKIAHAIKKEFSRCSIQVYSDSQIITRQFNGIYQIKKQEFFKYKEKAKLLWLKINMPFIEWIPRELNTHADKLSKEGIQIAYLKSKNEYSISTFRKGV